MSETPLRIALIAGEYPPLQGGLGDYTRELARALVELGHDVRVITRAENLTPRPPSLRGKGASITPPLPGEGPGEGAERPTAQDLTPHPPSLRGKGASITPPLPGEGPGEGLPHEPRVLRVVDHWGWRAWPTVRASLADAHVVHIQYQTAAYGMRPFINALPWLLRRWPPPSSFPPPRPAWARGPRGEGPASPPRPAWERGPGGEGPASPPRPAWEKGSRGEGPASPPRPAWERGPGGEGTPLLVTTYHDTRIPYLFPKAGRVRAWVTDLPGRGSDLIIATNPEDGARLRHLSPPLAFIPIGSNITPTATRAEADAFRATWGIGPDEALLVYFGFVNRAKGADTLMLALAQVRAAGLPARLLMLGGQVGASDPTNAQFLAEVRGLAESLGVAQAIIWTDFLPEAEVSAALTSADMATLPYRDGVSLQRGTLMAALAHGLPIVTTRPPLPPPASPLPSLVDDVNAVLVPPDTPDALAQAILALWRDPPRRERLGGTARDLSALFRWEHIAQQHVLWYKRAAETKRR